MANDNTSTSEVLRERAADPEPAKPSMPDIASALKDIRESFEKAQTRLNELTATELVVRQTGAKSLGETREKIGQLQAPGVPPVAPQLPAIPPKQHQPFLAMRGGESPWQAFQKTLFGLGLLAQMAYGLKSGPRAALASFSGALTGWAEGDNVRATREWHRWGEQLNVMLKQHELNRNAYRDVIEKYGTDIDRLQLELSLKAAEMSESLAMVQAARTNVNDFIQMQDHIGQLLLKQADTYAKWDANRLARESLERHRGELARHNLAMEQIGLLRAQLTAKLAEIGKLGKMVGETGRLWINADGEYAPADRQVHAASKDGFFELTPKEEGIINDLPTAMKMLDNLVDTSKKLRDQHGYRTSSGFAGAFETGHLAYEKHFGDPNQVGGLLRLWDSQKSELISLYRRLGEKGNVAARILTPQLEGMTASTGFPATINMLKFMESQLLASVQQSRVPGVAKKLPKMPDLMMSSDPAYKTFAKNGLTDEQIEKQYNVIVVK